MQRARQLVADVTVFDLLLDSGGQAGEGHRQRFGEQNVPDDLLNGVPGDRRSAFSLIGCGP
ncbi:hypothetical protein D3C86_2234250 [compost metagenome]